MALCMLSLTDEQLSDAAAAVQSDWVNSPMLLSLLFYQSTHSCQVTCRQRYFRKLRAAFGNALLLQTLLRLHWQVLMLIISIIMPLISIVMLLISIV